MPFPRDIPVRIRTKQRPPFFERLEVQVVGRITRGQELNATKIKILELDYIVNPYGNNLYLIVPGFIGMIAVADLGGSALRPLDDNIRPAVELREPSLWALAGRPLYQCPGDGQELCTNDSKGHRMRLSACPEDQETWCSLDEHGHFAPIER